MSVKLSKTKESPSIEFNCIEDIRLIYDALQGYKETIVKRRQILFDLSGRASAVRLYDRAEFEDYEKTLILIDDMICSIEQNDLFAAKLEEIRSSIEEFLH